MIMKRNRAYVRTPAAERFWPKVVQDGDCWRWTGAKANGYGKINLGPERDGFIMRAHVFAYQEMVGEIPDGLVLDHLCRNRACVNPDHLEPVTHKVNIRRGFADRGRRTHCKRGHAYEGNTYTTAWQRYCATCRTAWLESQRQKATT